MRVDKITMATSVEARVPFLDHHLIEYALALPRQLKVKGATGKHILKQALESVLPRDVLYKPKRGFGAPTREWFRGPKSDDLVQLLMNSSIRERSFFDYKFIQHLVDEHRRDDHVHHSISAAALIIARSVQGFATGLATATLGTMILDTDRSRAPVLLWSRH